MSKPVQSTQESPICPVGIGEIVAVPNPATGPRHERTQLSAAMRRGLAALTGPQPKPVVVRVDVREHTTRLPDPNCLRRLLPAPARHRIGGVDRAGGFLGTGGHK